SRNPNPVMVTSEWVLHQQYSTVSQAIKNLLQLPWMVRIEHIFREGNRVVDGLASMSFSRPFGRYIFMQPPDEVLKLLHDNYSGMAWPRLV
ncbi:hypothetical protein J1N35_040948, partial [Gossypium stocksii]